MADSITTSNTSCRMTCWVGLTSSVRMLLIKLPLKLGVLVCEDTIFDGLFGVFEQVYEALAERSKPV